jgi:hypothetical protein
MVEGSEVDKNSSQIQSTMPVALVLVYAPIGITCCGTDPTDRKLGSM